MTSTTKSTSVLNRLVHRASHLYSLPAVAMQVVELTNHPQVDTRALKECIENDPALTSKVLRVVNSSLFGLSREVGDLKQALALLGTKPLKLLVLGFSLPKNLFEGVKAESLEHYWHHSLVKAVAARELSERVWGADGDEAFIGGLLQGIGILVMVQELGDPYIELYDRVRAGGEQLGPTEVATLGFDHAVLSARLLRHWGLPESLVQALALPQDIERLTHLPPDERDLPQCLHLAELISAILTDDRPQALEKLIDAGYHYRQLDLEVVTELVNALREKVEQLADILSLQLPGEADYSQILLAAYAQLSDAAAGAACELARTSSDSASLLDEADRLLGELAGERTPRGSGATSAPQPARPTAPVAVVTPEKRSANLRGAVSQLRQQDRPLSSPLDDPGLQGLVSSAIAGCRQARKPLSFILLELDHFDQLVLTSGKQRAEELVRKLAAAVASHVQPGRSLHLGDAQLGVALSDCDRQQGIETCRQLLLNISHWARQLLAEQDAVVTASGALATLTLPPKNFPPQELIEAAERCLYAARAAGGNCCKSIEIV